MALAFLDDPHRDFVECLPILDIRKQYEIIRELGRGHFAKVVLVRRRESGELFAAKMVRLDQSTSSTSSPMTEAASQQPSIQNRRARDQFQFELTLAYFLSPCPYIIRTQSDAFRTSHHMIALMEPALGGDLASRLKDPNTHIAEQQLKSIAIQLASAIQFIHERSLVHGDIRPENVLIIDPSMNVVKLGDFSRTKKSGSMVRYATVYFMPQQNGSPSVQKPSPRMTASHSSSGSETGTPRCESVSAVDSQCYPVTGADAFCPPEINELSPSDFYTVHASQDAWGYGLILFCLSIERVPSWLTCSTKTDPVFSDFVEALYSTTSGHISASGTSSDLYKTATVNGSLSFYRRSLSRLTASFISLLRGMLDVDPSNRAQIKMVRNCALHKWLQDVKPSKTQKPLGTRTTTGRSTPAFTIENSRNAESSKCSSSPNSSLDHSGLERAHSETALDELSISSHVKNSDSNSIHNHTNTTSSPSTSISADNSSAGDPASPKVQVASGNRWPDE